MCIARLVSQASFLFVLMLGALPADAATKQKWLRASTDEVYILSDASPKAVAEYAVKYSAFRQAFARILAPEGHPPPPVVLILFRSEKELRDHLARTDKNSTTVAANIEVDNMAMLALADSGDRDQALSMAFEFDTIWSLRRVGYFLPLWMTQGTGEVMASLQIKKGECVIGNDLARVAAGWNRSTLLPWKRFFDIYAGSPEYSGKNANGVYQAQAWALMNCILFQEGEPRDRFMGLAKKISDRQDEMQAVESLVGVPAEKLEKAISRHLGGNHEVKIPFDEKAILARLKIEPADEAEVMVRESDLLVTYGREDEGNALVDRAAALAPQATYVNEALARREMRRQDQTAAARFYRMAIAAGSTNTNAWIISAAERLTQVQAYGGDMAGGGNKGTRIALDEVHHALQLDPGSMDAWRLLGRVYFVLEQAEEAGLADLSRVVTDSENGLQVRYYRGLLHSRLGHAEEAVADLSHIATHARAPEVVRRSAANFLTQLQFGKDKQQVEQLVKDEKYDEARIVVARGSEQATGTPTVKSYGDLLDWLEENASWVKTVELYNSRDWAGALAAVKQFFRDYPRSTLTKEARKLAAAAEEKIQRAQHKAKTSGEQ